MRRYCLATVEHRFQSKTTCVRLFHKVFEIFSSAVKFASGYTARMAPIVEFRRAGYAINGRALLEDISFQVESGEIIVLLGRSGSGKTTTLKLINRLLEPTSGEVLVEGKNTVEWDPIRLRRRIGYVIQEIGLFPHFTVARNVALVPSLESWPEEKLDRRVKDMLELVGLD